MNTNGVCAARVLMGIFVLGMVAPNAGAVSSGAEVVVMERFENLQNGALGPNWSLVAPPGTTVEVSQAASASGSKSLRFDKINGSGGAYPQATLAFPVQSGRVVRITYRAMTRTSNHDALYVKLRNDKGKELGGVRFSTTGKIQYQRQDGTWSDTPVAYEADRWREIDLQFDLGHGTYAGWADGTVLFQGAAFRMPSVTAGSLIIQDRVVAGSGASYVDDLKIAVEP